MFREDLQALAKLRLREAGVLLKHGLYDGAYHVAGFAVECGLKACIAKKTLRFQFPDKDYAKSVFTHSLTDLVKYAELTSALQQAKKIGAFDVNWSIVIKWDPEQRYQITKTLIDADGIYKAIASRNHGILKWIRTHW